LEQKENHQARWWKEKKKLRPLCKKEKKRETIVVHQTPAQKKLGPPLPP